MHFQCCRTLECDTDSVTYWLLCCLLSNTSELYDTENYSTITGPGQPAAHWGTKQPLGVSNIRSLVACLTHKSYGSRLPTGEREWLLPFACMEPSIDHYLYATFIFNLALGVLTTPIKGGRWNCCSTWNDYTCQFIFSVYFHSAIIV